MILRKTLSSDNLSIPILFQKPGPDLPPDRPAKPERPPQPAPPEKEPQPGPAERPPSVVPEEVPPVHEPARPVEPDEDKPGK